MSCVYVEELKRCITTEEAENREKEKEKQKKLAELDALIQLLVQKYDIKVDLSTGNITITRKKKAE